MTKIEIGISTKGDRKVKYQSWKQYTVRMIKKKEKIINVDAQFIIKSKSKRESE